MKLAIMPNQCYYKRNSSEYINILKEYQYNIEIR